MNTIFFFQLPEYRVSFSTREIKFLGGPFIAQPWWLLGIFSFLSSLIPHSIAVNGHLLNSCHVKGTVLGTCLLCVK